MQNVKKLTVGEIIIFSLPTIPTVMILAPLGGVLPAFYAANTAATMATIGLVLVLSRIVDAVTDPLIGFLSDRTRSKLGPRKPWMIGGAILAMICAYPLFSPPPDASATYFMIWSGLAYIAWTAIFLPYNAWTSELSGDYHERSRIFAYRNLIGAIAPMLFAPITGSTEMNADALRIVGLMVIVLMPICVGITVIWGPERAKINTEEASFKGLLQALSQNRLLWFFMAITVMSGLATGIQLSLSFLVLNYMELGAQFTAIAGASMLAGIIAIPIWLRLAKSFGKHKVWAVAMVGQVVVLPVMLMLTPGPDAFWPFLLLVAYTNVLGACVLVTAGAMLSDIIDYDILKTGANRTGSYFAFFSLLGKINLAFSGGLGFYIAAKFGFDAGGANDESAAFGLIIAFAGVPAVLGLISGVMRWFYPLDARQQKEIRAQIEARDTAKNAAA